MDAEILTEEDLSERHRAFVEETLSILDNPDYIDFDSVEEAMEAIRNFKE
ncbi:MAG: hypothetical protein HQL02_07400 [Nitrospirae bacterium]|nr:hypothetical protein [Nitrospirota bacterium]